MLKAPTAGGLKLFMLISDMGWLPQSEQVETG